MRRRQKKTGQTTEDMANNVHERSIQIGVTWTAVKRAANECQRWRNLSTSVTMQHFNSVLLRESVISSDDTINQSINQSFICLKKITQAGHKGCKTTLISALKTQKINYIKCSFWIRLNIATLSLSTTWAGKLFQTYRLPVSVLSELVIMIW